MNLSSSLYNKLYSFACSDDYCDLYLFILDRFETMSRDDQITCIDFFKELYYCTLDSLLDSNGKNSKYDRYDLKCLAKLHNYMYCYVYDIE